MNVYFIKFLVIHTNGIITEKKLYYITNWSIHSHLLRPLEEGLRRLIKYRLRHLRYEDEEVKVISHMIMAMTRDEINNLLNVKRVDDIDIEYCFQ